MKITTMITTLSSLIGITLSNITFAQSPSIPLDTQDQPYHSFIVTYKRDPIIGLWQEVDAPNQCVEFYNFRDDGSVIINSNQEWLSGTYHYRYPEQRHQPNTLYLLIEQENFKRDCDNQSQDDRGAMNVAFVHWLNPNKVKFCHTPDLQRCFTTLRRVLP